jgi:DNA-binding NarL/FixJ family response regulator
MSIKVLIADDHKLLRELMADFLNDTADIDVVAQAGNGQEVLEKVKYSYPDVVLMDIEMPRLNGIDATAALHKEYPDIKTIALSMHDEQPYIRSMFEAGAWGYLLKNCAYDQLGTAINQVYNGKKYLDNDVSEVIIQDYLQHFSWGAKKQPELSEREAEVLKLLAEGSSVREISDTLFISVKTVGSHKQNIFEKLEFENMAQLFKFAFKNGIVSL